MDVKFNYHFAKLIGKIGFYSSKLGSGSGGNFSGYLFNRFGSEESLSNLSSQLKIGSVLVTGTNGKTTTTILLIKLLSNDLNIRKSYENNTINSITTALLNQKGDLGVFEYGIRNTEFGIPDKVQKLIAPIGVVYTTISREHTQVNGIKNPFKSYIHAKKLLSQDMKKGVIVCNADDPITAEIGISKQNDIKVNFFGIECGGISDLFDLMFNFCPVCSKKLNYSKRFLNHRGLYSCECGFKRPQANVKLTDIVFSSNNWILTIEGDVYNYINKCFVSFNLELKVPPFGIHNIYNTLASITAYATFTPKIENIENNIKNVFNNLDMSFIPPGRFEIIDVLGKHVGIGQGDNGDAIKINASFMQYSVKGPLEFIYTTPDEGEDEIFRDHLEVIKALNPQHIIVVPGRKSSNKAKEYYNIIKKEFHSAEFHDLGYENMDKRIAKLTQLAIDSKYEYIIMTGCGEEQAMWENIKQNLFNL